MSAKLAIIVTGIKVKLNRGENLEDILVSYIKLTKGEKEKIRECFKTVGNAQQSGAVNHGTIEE